MKKKIITIFLVLTVFFCIMLTMSCDDDDDTIGLGGGDPPTPENIFAGGEWERKELYNDKVQYYSKISFSENEFVFYEKQEHPIVNYEHTFTGTYLLFFDEDNEGIKNEKIKFISNEPNINGTLRYSFSVIYKPDGGTYPDDTVWFFDTPDNFPISGIYTKILP